MAQQAPKPRTKGDSKYGRKFARWGQEDLHSSAAEPIEAAPAPAAATKTYTGRVKWFDTGKGFGFIVPDDGSSDVFVHIRAVESSGLLTLNENGRVSYGLAPARRPGRFEATSLRRIG